MTNPEPEISATVEKITPELAAEYLQHNVDNRKLHDTTIDRYLRALRAGRWKLSHQGIAFDTNGRLVDGQHRLHAIVLSGLTVELLVVRNVAPDTFDTLDAGKPRSAADTLGLLGGTNRAHVASALRMMKAYAIAQREDWHLFHAIRNTRLDNWEIEPWFTAYPQTQLWVAPGRSVFNAAKCLPSLSAVVATLTLAARVHPRQTQTFIDAITSMEGLKAGSAPITLIRKAPIQDRGYDAQAMTMIILAKALKNWFNGVTAARLIIPPFSQLPELGYIELPNYTPGHAAQKGTSK